MPGFYSGYKVDPERRKRRLEQKKKYIDKGCSERKAEELLYRYSCKWE